MLGKQSGVCSSDSKSSGGIPSVTFDSTKDGFKSNTDSEGRVFSASNSFFGNRSTPVYSHSLSFPLSDLTHTRNSLNLFENTSSTDFLYDDLPEIGCFDDVDRIFRRSYSTFGLEDSKEDELGWLSSDYDKGESGEALRSDFGFPCHDTSMRANVSENQGSSKSYTELSEARILMKGVSCTQEKSDSSTSFVNGLGICDGKYCFIPEEQMNECKHMEEKRNEPNFGNGSNSYLGNLPYELNQLSSGTTSLQGYPSEHMSQRLRATGPDSFFCPLSGNDNGADTYTFQSNLSSQSTSLMEQASIQDPGLVGNQVKLCGDTFENAADAGGVSLVIPVEPGSSNKQESSMINMGAEYISLAAASFCQLQLVMEWLDLSTKLCIRDGLYRLAQSAEQRLNHANSLGNSSGGSFMAEETNNCTGHIIMETGTNPIDRSIAQLLFHRSSDSSVIFAHDV
ncbi:protein LNK1-like isoform X1 [Primulina huaijiensis]|uniref:protein LNK1-like isoform X1 n=1 Tax=Primulina huaijiensis TaxID=1492673 RepID=UPI003CC6DD4A